MNESVIKEIKALYSSKSNNNHHQAVTPEVCISKSKKKIKKPFFYSVIDKLNINK